MNIPSSFAIATADECRKIDAATVDSFGIDEFTLMEIAGFSASKKILAKVEKDDRGVFLCGKGNNGGDALVIARYLVQHNIACTIVFVGGNDDLSPTAQKNFDLLQKITAQDSNAAITFCDQWADLDQTSKPNFIIDGMLGTGLDSKLRGDYPDAVRWANTAECPVYALDIPTGLHADTGQVLGETISATETFAFGMLKQGFYLGNGPQCTGTITFCELPFPDYVKKDCSTFLIDDAWLPERQLPSARHKYEAGIVYIIAGSEGLTGAAIMAAKSAWSEGIGAVILICPRGLLSIFEYNLPQIIKKPVGNKNDLFFNENHLPDVMQIVRDKPGTTLIGPGLGRQEPTVKFVQDFLADHNQDCIIDADALWALSQKSDWQKPDASQWVLTPHPGELSTLLNKSVENDSKRVQKVRTMSKKRDLFLLSKGFPSILSTPEGQTFITGYDTHIFSRAGFGDVLAGKIAAYSAMQYTSAESCIRALLDGYNKALQMQVKHDQYIPEPLDFI